MLIQVVAWTLFLGGFRTEVSISLLKEGWSQLREPLAVLWLVAPLLHLQSHHPWVTPSHQESSLHLLCAASLSTRLPCSAPCKCPRIMRDHLPALESLVLNFMFSGFGDQDGDILGGALFCLPPLGFISSFITGSPFCISTPNFGFCL